MQSLLENISLLTRILQHPVSYATLSTLTPMNSAEGMDYRVLGEVLSANGFENTLQKRLIKKIPSLTLPVILLMQDNQAVVLKDFDGEDAIIEIADMGSQRISLADLSKNYLGYTWFIKPKLVSDTRSELPEYQLAKGWFWRVIWRFRRYYFQIIIATFLINSLALVSSLYVMNVYDRVIPNKTFETLWVLSIGVFIAILFEFIAKVIRARLTDIAGKKADLIISAALFRRVLQIKMKDKPASAGSYANNLRDFESVREFMTSASLLAMVDIPFFLLFITVMHIVAGKLAIIPMSIIPIVILFGIFAQFPLARSINESMRESSQRQGLAVEVVSGIETLKSNNAYSWVQKRWNHYTAKSATSSMKTKDISSLITNLSAMMQQLNTVFIVVYGTYLYHAEDPAQRITMGAIIACVILSGRALAPVGQIAGLAVRFQQAKLSLNGVNQIAERPTEFDIDRKYVTFDDPKGSMSFKDCTFAYDDSGKNALNGLSLNIQAGEKVAILGRIGSGKSTLLKLASALYEQQEGMVTFDEVDVRQIDPYYLRSRIALLGQSPRLFLGTLRDNLDMAGNDGFFTDDALLGALNRFGMAQIIQQHPMGLDMPIGESGAGLSGGQQQIVALAQLTLKDPSIVLLDEPTSGLDQGSEQMVLNALSQWLNNKTLILVTHRPQLLALVNRIIVFDEGKIIMDGPKQQVLDQLKGQGQQAQVQSAQVQPAQRQPAQVQPTKVQPAQRQQAQAQPAQVQPAQRQQAQVQPTQVQPQRQPAQPTQVQPQRQQAQVQPTQVPTKVQSNQVQPTQIQTVQVQPAKVQTIQVQPSKVQTIQVQTAQVDAAKIEAAKIEAAKIEADKVEAAKVEADKVEAAKVEAAKVEAAKVEAAKVEADKVEAAKVEAAQIEADKVEAAQIEADKVEAEKVKAAQIEADKVEAEKVEAAQIEADKVEAAKVETAKVEAAKVEADKVEAAKVEADKVEAAKVEAAQIEADKVEAAKVEADKVEAAKVEAAQIEADKVEAAKVEAAQIEADKVEAAKVEAAQIEVDKAEKVEAAQIEADKVEAAKVEAAQIEADKVEAAKVEAAQIEADKVEAEKVEAAQIEADKVEDEKVEAAKVQPIQSQPIQSQPTQSQPVQVQPVRVQTTLIDQNRPKRKLVKNSENEIKIHSPVETKPSLQQPIQPKMQIPSAVQVQPVQVQPVQVQPVQVQPVQVQPVQVQPTLIDKNRPKRQLVKNSENEIQIQLPVKIKPSLQQSIQPKVKTPSTTQDTVQKVQKTEEHPHQSNDEWLADINKMATNNSRLAHKSPVINADNLITATDDARMSEITTAETSDDIEETSNGLLKRPAEVERENNAMDIKNDSATISNNKQSSIKNIVDSVISYAFSKPKLRSTKKKKGLTDDLENKQDRENKNV